MSSQTPCDAPIRRIRKYRLDTRRIVVDWQLNLEKVGADGDTSNYIPNTEWALVKQNTEWALVKLHVKRNVKFYSCCAEPYPDITYTILHSLID